MFIHSYIYIYVSMYVCVWCVYARVYACVRVCVCAGVRVNYIYVPLQFVVSFINGVCDM